MTGAALPCPTCGADVTPAATDLACPAGHAWRWDTVDGMPALVAVRQLSAPPARPAIAESRPALPVGEVRYSRASSRTVRIVADIRPARWHHRPSRLERVILAVRLIRQLIDPSEPCPYCPTPVFSRRPMAHTRRAHPIGR